MSALQYVEEIQKKFGIKGKKELHPREKQAYALSQQKEQQAIINRLVVDAAVAKKGFDEAKDPDVKASYENKLRGYEGDLRALTKTVDFFIELSEELAEKDGGAA